MYHLIVDLPKVNNNFDTDLSEVFAAEIITYMCKHVTAALYGIGARFDEDPTLFFKLRNIDFEVLLKKTIEQKMQSLLENADKKSSRVLDDKDVFELFGV